MYSPLTMQCAVGPSGVLSHVLFGSGFELELLEMSASESPLSTNRQKMLFEAIQVDGPDWRRQAYDAFHRIVRGLLIKSLGPSADVDDLLGEVFLGFFESAKNIRSAEGMRSYMVSVTMNTVRRELKRRKRRRLLFFSEEPSEIIDRAAGTDDPKAKAALLQLSRILDGLADEERVVFVLHVLDGMGLPEVAEHLSISLSTAKRRAKRARERIHRRVARNPLLADYIREKAESGPRESAEAPADAPGNSAASNVGVRGRYGGSNG